MICVRDSTRQSLPILELRLPVPRPAGAEWVDAYRRWPVICPDQSDENDFLGSGKPKLT